MYDAGWGETSPTLTAAYVGSTDEDDAMTTCRQVCGDDRAAALLFRWRDREAELLVSTPLFVALAAALVERLERQPELPGPVARSVLIVAQGRHEGLDHDEGDSMSTNGHREQASRVQAEADAADVDAAWDAQAELFRDWGLPVPQRPRVQWPKAWTRTRR